MSEETSSVFYRFAPFVQDFIYRNGWTDLREVQFAAAQTIFETDHNLLVTSATASGKTEAAFFPILSMMSEEMPHSVGAIYIAPLKSLINDQFSRLEELLDLSEIPVFHWHGDVSASHKNKLVKNPSGILQITPESLESMLVNRSNDMVRLFGDLRFVVIDEIHTLMGTDRGNQILCQLGRIARLIGKIPRRIGLSATIGDVKLAADWLGSGTNRATDAPLLPSPKMSWRLGMEHFYLQTESTEPIDPAYDYLYECVKNKKCLVFSNSREETEYITATLRQIAEQREDPDIFLIHHGNLSAAIREEAESKMKQEEQKYVTCATVTMELGIDIGKLERVVQVDAPHSVASFLQRLGRSGRREEPPEMMMVFREENPLPNTPLPQLIPWGLLRAIAIIQLYLEERFIEPPTLKKLPFSLLFQQTLSILASAGELAAKRLSERVLDLPPFQSISKEDYKALLLSMLQNEWIEMTEEKGLIVGLRGERLTNSFQFYAVFQDTEEYTVRCESDEIGTISSPPPVGDRFALAGRVWEVEELDLARKLLYVKSVKGKMEVSWPGNYGEIHTRILERMKQVLEETTLYPYLKPNARKRLELARTLAHNTGMLEHSIVPLGGYTWCFFPWLGTRSFHTLRRYIMQNASPFKISNLEYDGCYYMTFKMEKGNDFAWITYLCNKIAKEGIVRSQLISGKETPLFEKYDAYLPAELLRHAYEENHLRTDEIERRLPQILQEYVEKDCAADEEC